MASDGISACPAQAIDRRRGRHPPGAAACSNFIERTFGWTRRRAKVIDRFPSETTGISLVWAVLDRASRGFTMPPPDSAASKTSADPWPNP